MSPGGTGPRFYRTYRSRGPGRVPFRVKIATSDLYIRADRDLGREARAILREVRGQIEAHIARHPAFATALEPLDPPPGDLPAVVAAMYAAGRGAGVGPMAAVAGAVAGEVGRRLRELTGEVVVENGGDVYLDLREPAVVGLYAGRSPFTGRVGIRVEPGRTPLGVCTSSGRVGPSLSYGAADAATALCPDPALADAVATAMGNRVRGPGDLEPAVEWALGIPGIQGALAVVGDRLAAAGEIEIARVGDPPGAPAEP